MQRTTLPPDTITSLPCTMKGALIIAFSALYSPPKKPPKKKQCVGKWQELDVHDVHDDTAGVSPHVQDGDEAWSHVQSELGRTQELQILTGNHSDDVKAYKYQEPNFAAVPVDAGSQHISQPLDAAAETTSNTTVSSIALDEKEDTGVVPTDLAVDKANTESAMQLDASGAPPPKPPRKPPRVTKKGSTNEFQKEHVDGFALLCQGLAATPTDDKYVDLEPCNASSWWWFSCSAWFVSW